MHVETFVKKLENKTMGTPQFKIISWSHTKLPSLHIILWIGRQPDQRFKKRRKVERWKKKRCDQKRSKCKETKSKKRQINRTIIYL